MIKLNGIFDRLNHIIIVIFVKLALILGLLIFIIAISFIIYIYKSKLGLIKSMNLFIDQKRITKELNDYKIIFKVYNDTLKVKILNKSNKNIQDISNLANVFKDFKYIKMYSENQFTILEYKLNRKRKLIKNKEDIEHNNNYFLVNNVVFNYNHTVVSGHTGSGKTIMLLYLIKQMALTDIQALVIDPKQGSDLSIIAKKLKFKAVLEPFDYIACIDEIINEMNLRSVKLKNKQTDDINASYESIGYKPFYIVIDEISSISILLSKEDYKTFLAKIKLIALLGRSTGIYLLLATQQLNANNIPTEISNQILNKIVLGNSDNNVYKMIFGTSNSVSYDYSFDIGTGLYKNHKMKQAGYFELPIIDKQILIN